MVYQIIIVLAALAALIHSLGYGKSVIAKIIVIIQCLGIGLTFVQDKTYWTAGIVVFTLGIVAVIPYVLAGKTLSKANKIIMLIAAVPVAIGLLFQVNHWPYVSEISYAMVLTILAFFFAIPRYKELRNEWGLLILLFADAVIRLAIKFGALFF